MIIPITPVETPKLDPGTDDKHVQMAQVFAQAIGASQRRPQKNLTSVTIHQATRTNRVALILAPMWGPHVAPYGIARLAGLARHAGFETHCWDINIQCYDATKGTLWSHLWDWKWANPELYEKEIHPQILPVLERCLEEIVEFRPTVVGFTTYYTNNKCTTWLIQQLRQRIPNIRVLAGGPQSTQARVEHGELIDHFVQGEGELLFAELMENIESGGEPMPKVLIHDKNIRIDLDSMPIPDYRDFDISQYQFKGVASELSRGCIAKCQFCSETTFWKYRGRQAMSVLDEVEFNYKNYGIETVWFIDSLVNGNLKELAVFAQGLIDRNIKVKWAGFERNDGRMDSAYLKTLLDSGCTTLMIGVESGSQQVLDLIQKKVKVHEIEQNFRDLAELGAHNIAGSSWFVGFPGEQPQDVAHTMTMLWRLRDLAVCYMGFGICNQSLDTPLFHERQRFGISDNKWGGSWITKDWTNTIAHRVIRYKSVCILQNHYRQHLVRPEHLGKRCEQPGFNDHYHLTFDIQNWSDAVDYETDFAFDIIRPAINPLADSLVNEIWPLLRTLWLSMGAFVFSVRFDPDIDYPVLGDVRYFFPGTGKLWANYQFKINDQGKWTAEFYNKLESTYPDKLDYNFEHNWSGTGQWQRKSVDKD